MKNTTILALLCAALVLHTGDVAADVPETIPIQGRLTDASGIPLDGDHTVTFALYDGSDSEIFSETQVVSVEDGDFTAYLGTLQPLDASLIHGDISVGISVDGDPEMTPRLPFGSVPFAMHSPDVPEGMISHFDSPMCPTGWSPLEIAQGRTIVGIPEEGTLQGTVGNPLDDIENRTHSHNVDPAPVNSSSDGSHTHDTAAQSGLSTSSTNIAHTHSIPSLTGSTNSPGHNHRFFRTVGGLANTYDAVGASKPIIPFLRLS